MLCSLLLAITVAVLLPFPGTCDVASDGSGRANALEDASRQVYFDESIPHNVTAHVGKSAFLTCRVYNLGNHSVSWLRHRDSHILTAQTYTYTSDQRFSVIHQQGSDEWTLQIKWAQRRDAGLYWCQVSTIPMQSYIVMLHVIVPSARILGGPDLHVDLGSTINLTCVVQNNPEAPGYVIWYHEDEVITFDGGRGGVSVVTERGLVTSSSLLVQSAQPQDSGQYSCAPSNADLATVRVHVLSGERPAAMQTGSAVRCSLCMLAFLVVIALHSCWLEALFTC